MFLNQISRIYKKGTILHIFMSSLILLFLGGITGCSDQNPTKVIEQTQTSPEYRTVGNNALNPSGPVPVELTWGDGQLWELLSPHEIEIHGELVPSPSAIPSNHHSHQPLYVVAPIDPNNPQASGHGGPIGDHDHVVPVPPNNKGTFNANWHVWVVFDTSELPPEPPLSDDLAGGLTSVEDVQNAITAGDAVLADAEFVFICPIRPHHGD